MTATSSEPSAFCSAGPLFFSVTSPHPMMPQRTRSGWEDMARELGRGAVSGKGGSGGGYAVRPRSSDTFTTITQWVFATEDTELRHREHRVRSAKPPIRGVA